MCLHGSILNGNLWDYRVSSQCKTTELGIKMNKKDGPTARVLEVLDIVARKGPLTLNEITISCSFSRAAIWRALNVLRLKGWVRMRLGDNAFELVAEQAMQIAAGHRSFAHAQDVSDLLERLEQAFGVNVALGGFGRSSTAVTLMESTKKTDYRERAPNLLYDSLAIAAQLQLDRAVAVGVIRSYFDHCDDYDRRYIEQGKHSAALRNYARVGFVLVNKGAELSIPVVLSGQVGFGIRSKTTCVLDGDSVRHWLDANLNGKALRLTPS